MENSWEVLKRAIDRKGIKQISSDLKVLGESMVVTCETKSYHLL